MQLQNEFHLQPYLCLGRKFDWIRDVTLNRGKRIGHCLDPDESRVQLR